MMLLVDMGNSSLKWATLEEGALSPMVRCTWVDSTDVDAIAATQWSDIKAPERVLVSSVAGDERNSALAAWVKGVWQQEPVFVRAADEGFGVRNAYLEPQRLGVDRWAVLVAVRSKYQGALCVVDCGTAITIDVLSAEGQHLGGLIVPGLGLMRRALVEHTSINLEGGDQAGTIALLARDTRDAIMGGTLYTAIAAIDRIVMDVSEELGAVPTCVITGGDAEAVLPLLAAEYHYIPDLVLQGLACMTGALQ